MQPSNVRSVLAVGDDFDYSVFKIAIYFAENGLHVWFISPKAFDRAPKNIKTPDKEILQLITFMYLKDYQDLVNQLNGIHLWRKLPDVIIVTGFDHYCNLLSDDHKLLQSALIITSLLDSAGVCATKKKETIKLLITRSVPTETEIDKLQVLRDLYFKDYVYKTCDNEFYNTVIQLLI